MSLSQSLSLISWSNSGYIYLYNIVYNMEEEKATVNCSAHKTGML